MTTWPRGRSLDGGIDDVELPGASAGRLVLCGKHVVGPDPEAALARAEATVVVCLTERHELEDRYPDYVRWLRAETAGTVGSTWASPTARALWCPIHDLHAPPLDVAVTLVDALRFRLDAGEGVLLHCGAGIGRAGTIAACVLVALGATAEEALTTVAHSRPMAGPENGPQRDLVDAFVAHVRP